MSSYIKNDTKLALTKIRAFQIFYTNLVDLLKSYYFKSPKTIELITDNVVMTKCTWNVNTISNRSSYI